VKEAADQEGKKKAVLKAPIDRSVGHLRRPHRLTALTPEALDLIEPQSRGYAQNTTALLPCSPRQRGNDGTLGTASNGLSTSRSLPPDCVMMARAVATYVTGSSLP
jgi:hypothetical protein